MEMGVDINAQDNQRTALHFAASGGHKDTLIVLLENGADNIAPDNHARTALHYAASRGHKDLVTTL
jgi:ankyrin repeat protein